MTEFEKKINAGPLFRSGDVYLRYWRYVSRRDGDVNLVARLLSGALFLPRGVYWGRA